MRLLAALALIVSFPSPSLARQANTLTALDWLPLYVDYSSAQSEALCHGWTGGEFSQRFSGRFQVVEDWFVKHFGEDAIWQRPKDKPNADAESNVDQANVIFPILHCRRNIEDEINLTDVNHLVGRLHFVEQQIKREQKASQ